MGLLGFQVVHFEEEEGHLVRLTKEIVQKQNCACCCGSCYHSLCFEGLPLGVELTKCRGKGQVEGRLP